MHSGSFVDICVFQGEFERGLNTGFGHGSFCMTFFGFSQMNGRKKQSGVSVGTPILSQQGQGWLG
jgi:hypothetical protein